MKRAVFLREREREREREMKKFPFISISSCLISHVVELSLPVKDDLSRRLARLREN